MCLPIAILSIIHGNLTHPATMAQTRGESSAINQNLAGTPLQTKPALASPDHRAAAKGLGHMATCNRFPELALASWAPLSLQDSVPAPPFAGDH